MKDAFASKQRLNLAIADTASDTTKAPPYPIGPRCDEEDFNLAVARWLAAFAISAKFSATGPSRHGELGRFRSNSGLASKFVQSRMTQRRLGRSISDLADPPRAPACKVRGASGCAARNTGFRDSFCRYFPNLLVGSAGGYSITA